MSQSSQLVLYNITQTNKKITPKIVKSNNILKIKTDNLFLANLNKVFFNYESDNILNINMNLEYSTYINKGLK